VTRAEVCGAHLEIRERMRRTAHTSAYVSIRLFAGRISRFASAYGAQRTSAYVSIRQHTSAYVS
jgi:hypothetical protein